MNYVLMLKFCECNNQTLRIHTYHSREKAEAGATTLAKQFAKDYPGFAVSTYVIEEKAEE